MAITMVTKVHSKWKTLDKVLLFKIGTVQQVYHFYDHRDTNDHLFISNHKKAPCDPEYREFYL